MLGRTKGDLEHDALIKGNLATEANIVVLDMLELVVQVYTLLDRSMHAQVCNSWLHSVDETLFQVASQSDCLQGLLGIVFRVLLHALSCNQSTSVLHNMFATQRTLVFKVWKHRLMLII